MTPEEDWVRHLHGQITKLYSTFLDLWPLVQPDKYRSWQRLQLKEHCPTNHTLDLGLDSHIFYMILSRSFLLSGLQMWKLQNEEPGLGSLSALITFLSKFGG